MQTLKPANKKSGLNLSRMELDLLEINDRPGDLVSLLAPIRHAIKESNKRAASAYKNADEVGVDMAFNQIEDFLGISFVICQTAITSVEADVKRIHGFLERFRLQNIILRVPSKKMDLLKIGSRKVSRTGHTAVTLIDAFANYYKHRDQWRRDWSKLDNNSKPTAAIIEKAGACSGCSGGNLAKGAQKLGNTRFHNIELFASDVTSWHKEIKKFVREDFKAHQLI